MTLVLKLVKIIPWYLKCSIFHTLIFNSRGSSNWVVFNVFYRLFMLSFNLFYAWHFQRPWTTPNKVFSNWQVAFPRVFIYSKDSSQSFSWSIFWYTQSRRTLNSLGKCEPGREPIGKWGSWWLKWDSFVNRSRMIVQFWSWGKE